jgi:hypothetical protein
MNESILTSTKKILGLAEDYTVFDLDIMTHINSVFMTLKDLGIGPIGGFMITDKAALWADFLGADLLRFNAVKTYVYLRVKTLFDPPNTGYLVEAIDKQIKELEWRLNVERELTDWRDPNPDDVVPDYDQVLDGGAP